MLSSIPDRELMARLETLRRHERDAALDLLHHLNEVERRDLHLRLGYSSLFTYCTGHLGYCESDAGSRVRAARCLHRFPRVGPHLQSGEINLMTLGLIANIVTETTIDQWLERIRGKTQREVEALTASVRPPITLRDRARLVHVPAPSKSPLPLVPVVNTAEESPKTEETLFTSTQPLPPQAIEAVPPIMHPPAPLATQPKVFIQFLVEKSFMTKYRIAIDVLSNRLPRLTFEAVFTALLDDFIRRNEPVTRHERRELAAIRADERRARSPIPVGTRDAVFARDLGRCTFVGSDGKRCNETLRLHVDHINPVARGGSNDIGNLRLLCAQHNQLQAERLLGRGVMNGFRKRNNV
jgi:5-methylcytosine-specific restriction endonuclease McrA